MTSAIFIDYAIKGLAAFVAWTLVVLGWAVVSDLTNQRERKKSHEEKISALRQMLSDIEELAIQHHTTEFDDQRAKKIMRKIKGVGVECSHLERCGAITSAWRTENLRVRRNITLKNFESKRHELYPLNDNLVLDIEESFDKFQTYLLRAIESNTAEAERLRTTFYRILKKI